MEVLMSGNVVDLRVADRVVDEALVAEVERLLTLVKAGELKNLLLCGFYTDGSLYTYAPATDDVWRDLAGLDRLRHCVHRMIDEANEC